MNKQKPVQTKRYCQQCGRELPAQSTTRRRFCNAICRMRAHRAWERSLSPAQKWEMAKDASVIRA